ncbi:MAG: hypothetical protein R6W72_06470 [Desulfurivibrionaceae bacterium]
MGDRQPFIAALDVKPGLVGVKPVIIRAMPAALTTMKETRIVNRVGTRK